jgi:lipoprotein-releasing system permease protein
VPSDTPPFAPFEWLIAWRYLRARRKDGGISVIAWYALVGVMLGVATLIVVQAVMIGFREEFTERILGAERACDGVSGRRGRAGPAEPADRGLRRARRAAAEVPGVTRRRR